MLNTSRDPFPMMKYILLKRMGKISGHFIKTAEVVPVCGRSSWTRRYKETPWWNERIKAAVKGKMRPGGNGLRIERTRTKQNGKDCLKQLRKCLFIAKPAVKKHDV